MTISKYHHTAGQLQYITKSFKRIHFYPEIQQLVMGKNGQIIYILTINIMYNIYRLRVTIDIMNKTNVDEFIDKKS